MTTYKEEGRDLQVRLFAAFALVSNMRLNYSQFMSSEIAQKAFRMWLENISDDSIIMLTRPGTELNCKERLKKLQRSNK